MSVKIKANAPFCCATITEGLENKAMEKGKEYSVVGAFIVSSIV